VSGLHLSRLPALLLRLAHHEADKKVIEYDSGLTGKHILRKEGEAHDYGKKDQDIVFCPNVACHRINQGAQEQQQGKDTAQKPEIDILIMRIIESFLIGFCIELGIAGHQYGAVATRTDAEEGVLSDELSGALVYSCTDIG